MIKIKTIKAQISLEMLLVVLLAFAVIALVAVTIMGNAEKTVEKVNENSERNLDMFAANKTSGEACKYSSECESGLCIENEFGEKVCK